jgi:hypothetical protein
MINLFFITVGNVFAAEADLGGGSGLPTGGLDFIIKAVGAVIEAGLILATILAFIYLLLGGIKWITSAGDKQGLQNAKGTVTYALVGLILAFMSFAIIRFISTFFQVDLGAGYSRNYPFIPSTGPNNQFMVPAP